MTLRLLERPLGLVLRRLSGLPETDCTSDKRKPDSPRRLSGWVFTGLGTEKGI